MKTDRKSGAAFIAFVCDNPDALLTESGELARGVLLPLAESGELSAYELLVRTRGFERLRDEICDALIRAGRFKELFLACRKHRSEFLECQLFDAIQLNNLALSYYMDKKDFRRVWDELNKVRRKGTWMPHYFTKEIQALFAAMREAGLVGEALPAPPNARLDRSAPGSAFAQQFVSSRWESKEAGMVFAIAAYFARRKRESRVKRSRS